MEQISEGMRQYNLISSEIEAAYHKLNVKLGLSDTASYILYTLYEKPDSSQNDIVRFTGLTKQTINSAVKKMISQGLFSPMKGLRNEPLVLTKKGRTVMEENISVIVHIENSIFQQWSTEEQKQFTKMNLQYLEKLKQEVDRFSPKGVAS